MPSFLHTNKKNFSQNTDVENLGELRFFGFSNSVLVRSCCSWR
jgi:hypothetical protein